MTARSRHWLKKHTYPWMAMRTCHRCNDMRLLANELVELRVETGTTEHECGPHDFSHVELVRGPKPDLKTAAGALLKHYGQRTVDFWCQGEELRVKLTVVDVKRPIMSESRLRGTHSSNLASNSCVEQPEPSWNPRVVVDCSLCKPKLFTA